MSTTLNLMGWSQWHSLGTPAPGIRIESIDICLNTFGQLELFAKASDKNIYRSVQTSLENNTWSSWITLGSPRPGDDMSSISVAKYADERIELFVISPSRSGEVYYSYQISPTEDWSSWISLGSPTVGQTLGSLVAMDYDRDRLDIFVNSPDGNIYQKYQDTPFSWSSWRYIRPPVAGGQIGTPAYSRPVGNNFPLEIFVPSFPDRKIYHNKESISAPGQWTGWNPLGSPVPGGDVVFSSKRLTSRKDIFSLDRYNVYNKYYTASGWSGWDNLGNPGTAVGGRIVSVGRNAFGQADLFVSEGDNLLHKQQYAPDFIWSSPWRSLGTPSPGRKLIAAKNFNYKSGQIAVVVIDAGGEVHYIRQI